MDGCYYVGVGAQAFGWTQIVPSIVGICFLVLTAWTRQVFFVIFGTFLYLPQFVLWCFQRYFEVVMPDPVCQLYHSYAFPSITTFYVAVLITVFFIISYWWNYSHPWSIYVMFYGLVLIVPFILVWTGYNQWWQVLFSLGFGVAVGIFFVVIFRYYVSPIMPYLLFQFPLWHMGYQDTFLLSDRERSKYKQLEREWNTSVQKLYV